MGIINKAKTTLPGFMLDAFNSICQEAHLHPSQIDLTIKKRNRYIGDCWAKKGDRNIPSGTYHMDYRAITVRIGNKTHPDDFRFVLAHEIGHLVDHLKHRYNTQYNLTEKGATQFALACNCLPHNHYRGTKGRTHND